MWKREGVTKADVIQYYSSVADMMIPLIKNRPLMLNRFPHGVPGKSFVQKDWPSHPNWVKIAKVRSHSLNKSVRHVVCDDKATLVWLADMAFFEIKPFPPSPPGKHWDCFGFVDFCSYPPRWFGGWGGVCRAGGFPLAGIRARSTFQKSGAGGVP